MRLKAGGVARRGAGAVVVAGAAVLALAAFAAAATNLIANGTFEGEGSGSLTGWGGSNGTLTLVAGHGGGHAARVKASSTSQVYGYTTTRPVKTTVKGTAYQLDGSVRSDTAGQRVCLKLKELPSGSSTAVGSAQACVTTTTAWQPFPSVSYTTVGAGDSLTANVVEASPASGATYDIDDVSLVAGSSPSSPPPSPAGPCGSLASSFNPASPPAYTHVVVVMDENLSYNGWFGSPAAPYTNGLAGQCALATNAVAATHPSQPNYLAPMSGVLQIWNGAAQHSSADNLFHQLGAAGMSWLNLEESMSKACSGTTAGLYKTGHNPAFWFTDLTSAGDGSCAKSDLGFTLGGFNPSTLASFTWITPNLCDDMHWQSGCPGTKATRVQSGDTWLSQLLPSIFASAGYQAGNTIVLITWDEGNESATKGIDCTAQSNIDSTGCHVGLVAASAYITPGTRDGTRYTPYSTLASIETMDGLALLGRAQTAIPLGPGMGF